MDSEGAADRSWRKTLAVAFGAAHHFFSRRRRCRTLAAWLLILHVLDSDDDDSEDGDGAPRVKRTRRVNARPEYTQSAWGLMLHRKAELLDLTSTESKVFRQRFRVLYPFFLEVVKLAKEKSWFPTAERDVVGPPCIPVELKVGVGFSTRWLLQDGAGA